MSDMVSYKMSNLTKNILTSKSLKWVLKLVYFLLNFFFSKIAFEIKNNYMINRINYLKFSK